MLYVMRLTTGDCIIAVAPEEDAARKLADGLLQLDCEKVVSIRQLSRFALRFSPAESGDLEARAWDDAALDDILIHEYPLLNDAFHTANTAPFMPAPDSNEPLFTPLRQAYKNNTEIIRKGLQLEQQRLSSEPALQARKATQK